MLSTPPSPPPYEPRDYAVHSRSEIITLLRTMQKRHLLVNLDLRNSRQIVVTSVIGVNERRGTLILDSARGDALNQELMAGKGAEFITQLDGVSITFSTGPVTLCEFEKLPALRIAIPDTLIRLQRREHFRVHLPIMAPVLCMIPPQTADGIEANTTHIVDISCGGVALAEVSGRLGVETGREFADCRILLPDAEPLTVSLEVRNSAQIRLQSGAFQTRLGCRFINPPNELAARLQCFVMDIERARRNNQ
jgi:c-di-GMP-binding flagellar brake protein YcgR